VTNFGLAQTTEPPGHKPLVVNVVVVGAFEEEEEGIGVASDIVKAMAEDPDTLSYQGETGVGDLRSWMRLPWLADDEAPGPYITIPQYRFNKTKQHTLSTQTTLLGRTRQSASLDAVKILLIRSRKILVD